MRGERQETTPATVFLSPPFSTPRFRESHDYIPQAPWPRRDTDFPLPVEPSRPLLRPAPERLPQEPRDTRVVRGSSWDS